MIKLYKEESKGVFILILIMCLLRIGLASAGYFYPSYMIAELGEISDATAQMIYIIRVWAIRDIVLGFLVLFSSRKLLIPLLIGCVVIDCSDLIVPLLNYFTLQTSLSSTLSLMSTAILALIPESIALILILKANKRLEK